MMYRLIHCHLKENMSKPTMVGHSTTQHYRVFRHEGFYLPMNLLCAGSALTQSALDK